MAPFAFSYIIATAGQANSLNQDINGVGKTFDPAATWSSLGVISNDLTASGVPVPEPGTAMVIFVVVSAIIGTEFWRKRRATIPTS